MDRSGWIKLHRSLMNSAVWRDCTPEQNRILITLMCMANYEEKTVLLSGKAIKLHAGQFVTSLGGIVEKCASDAVTPKKVRTALKLFAQLGFLKVETTTTYTLITITNWTSYQQGSEWAPDEAGVGKAETSQGQTVDKPEADQGQTEGKAWATDNNINNIKNFKKTKTQEGVARAGSVEGFVKPDIEEVRAFCAERGSKIDPDRFYDYYESNGWMVGKNKMQSWKASVRHWEKSEEKSAAKAEKRPFLTYGQREYTKDFLEDYFKKKEGF